MLRESATVDEGRGGENEQQRGTVAVLGRGERGEREVAVPFRVHIVILAPDAQQSK